MAFRKYKAVHADKKAAATKFLGMGGFGRMSKRAPVSPGMNVGAGGKLGNILSGFGAMKSLKGISRIGGGIGRFGAGKLFGGGGIMGSIGNMLKRRRNV